MRVCIDCGVVQPYADFPLLNGAKGKAGYRRKRCKLCWLKRRAYQYETADKARMFRWRYGITLEQRDEMLAGQGGECAICRRPEPNGHDWCVDHDHSCCPEKSRSCGKCIRGILCHSCNSAIGLLGDDPTRLRDAASYIERNVNGCTE